MVTKEELAEKISNGDLSIDDVNDFFTVLCDIANGSDEIKDEVEGWDRVLVFDVEDGAKATLKVKDGNFSFEDGANDSPDVTLTMNPTVAVGVLSGETDATSAYMAGDLKVTGPLPDAIKFRTITELFREAIEG
jgi:putative sterol carrier protein